MFPFITNLLTNRYWTLLLVVQAGREIVSSVTSLFYKPVLQVKKIPFAIAYSYITPELHVTNLMLTQVIQVRRLGSQAPSYLNYLCQH